MNLLDLTFATPAENLACDEALLNWAEAGGDEILRFWEPQEHFVVVGYANKVEMEVNVAACEAGKIPVFRRCSGGGTVLQGPGCLNYALILQIAGHPSLANISSANKFIMERNCKAVQSAIAHCPLPILVCGHTDLALATRHSSPGTPMKFSGNSQRRHKRALLFHGTFLLNFEIPLINQLLRMPSKQPAYRNQRCHEEFLTNLNLSADQVKVAMQKLWGADSAPKDPPLKEISELVREKYATRAWNWKF